LTICPASVFRVASGTTNSTVSPGVYNIFERLRTDRRIKPFADLDIRKVRAARRRFQ
jgi:hypothetical protein